jgi:hypothetical protein
MQSKSELSIQAEKPTGDDEAQVFVWSSGLNTLGHVSLQLDNKKPKYKKNDPGNYLSIWPKSTPAGGLTSVWPLQATLARTLEDDCIQEAPRPREDFANLMYPVEIDPAPPDRVFNVKNLDKEKIKNELNRLEEGIENGKVRYQLIPGLNVAGFFNRLIQKNLDKPEVYNCVTLTQHLLEAGGMKMPEGLWTTPSKFADNLSKQPDVTQNTIPEFKV